MRKYTVYAIGAALVDTEIEVTDSELEQMGVEKGVMTLVDQARQVELLNHLENHLVRASHASGGSAGNSVIATAQFGGPTYMSCKVANDFDGDIYLMDLEQCGVDHGLREGRLPGTTGKCLVMITPDAERSMNTYLGVSETLSVNEVNPEAIATSDWVYLEGYLVTSPTGHAAALRTKEIARVAGTKTAISFSDPGMVEFFRDNMEAMVEGNVDLIFCNAAEAMGWARTDNIEEAFDCLKKVASSFVITMGSDGALTWDGTQRFQVAAHKVDAVNTNGAGDMFAGAFLYALSRGADYRVATEFSVRAAGEVVKFFGPRLKAEDCRALRLAFFGD